MARLGELLVATKLLTPEQVEQALRAQVMWGGRLGTNLIELGFLDLDQLSQALGQLHRLPAALARHFDKADPAVQRKLSPEFAERYATVPLMRVASGKIVVASLGIVDARGIGIIADELETTAADLVVSVAAELRIRYHLERAYNIPRGARFLRSRGKSIPPFPAFVTEELDFEDSAVSTPMPLDQRTALAEMYSGALTAEADAGEPLSDADLIEQVDDSVPVVTDDSTTTKTEVPLHEPPTRPSSPALDLTLELLGEHDDLSIGQEPVDEKAQRDRRTYVRMITDQPSTESERRKLGRIAIRRVVVTTGPTQTLGEATRLIRRSTDRDKVAELVMITLEKFVHSLEAAVMLVLRGDVAIGWKGFCKAHSTLPEVAIPLEQPGLIPTSIQRGCTVRSTSTDLGPIDQLLLASLGATGEKELIVVPVMIAGQAMLTIALVAPVETEAQTVESIAIATGAAFSRLMRDASR
ncbi:MAG: hypothetical protein H0V17_26365 [Deltaproteobacteria bacterium]|nr:hypothetical protein [Deltaproteobacteria bacterium]